jgi:tetratricopeptide (TPR) repeat protein
MARKSPPPRKKSRAKARSKAKAGTKKAAPKASQQAIPELKDEAPSLPILQKLAEQRIWLVLGLLLITVLAFSPMLDNAFINWDDDRYIYENPDIQGINGENLKAIFSSYYVSNYQPVTMLSLMLNHAMGKLSPAPYLWTNLLLHLLNTALVFFFAFRLSRKRIEVGLIVAALFALHPMHVESVAWASERKDVLYTAFFMGGLLTWLRYLWSGERKFYLFTLGLFALSVLSKPAAVVFPLVLLLLVWYENEKLDQAKIKRALLESLPFFAISLVIGLVTLDAQSATAIIDAQVTTFSQKVLSAFYGFSMYFAKLIAPVKLSAFYPYPFLAPQLPALYYAGPIIFLALAGLVIYGWGVKKSKVMLFAAGFFLINIILVLQFLQVGGAVMADRYTYVPYIGLFFGLAMGYSYLLRQRRKPWASLATGALALALIGCAWGSFQRTDVWDNDEVLWTDVIEKYPGQVPTSYLNRGKHYFTTNQKDKAKVDWEMAAKIKPDYQQAFNNLGMYHVERKEFDQAIARFDRSLELDPNYATSLKYRGSSYVNKQQFDQAIADYQRYIQLRPGDAYGYHAMGVCYQNSGKYAEAEKAFTQAIQRDPSKGFYFYNRSVARGALGKQAEAQQDAQRAKQLGFQAN